MGTTFAIYALDFYLDVLKIILLLSALCIPSSTHRDGRNDKLTSSSPSAAELFVVLE